MWTDNNLLKNVLMKPKLDACEQRCVAKVAPFDFDICHIPGPKNVVADALSREPFVRPRIRVEETPGDIENFKTVGKTHHTVLHRVSKDPGIPFSMCNLKH